MARILTAGLLAAMLATTTFVGCGPRAELAQQKMLEKLDKVLGELDVKRKKIEVKQRELRNQLSTVRERRIESQVRLENLQEKKENGQAKIDELKGKLVKVRALVEEAKTGNGELERDGTVYKAEDIKASADRVIKAFNAETTRMEGIDTSIKALQSAFDSLSAQENMANDLMGKLESKVDEIDAKKIAVDAVREASSISGDSQTIADNLADLEKEIEGLSIDVETALRVEQEKMDELASTNNAADELLTESPSLDTISSDIDKLLGGDE